MILRTSCLAAVALATVVACGGNGASDNNAKSASIASMPAYPDAKQQAKEKEASKATEPAKPTDPKVICKDAADVKVSGIESNARSLADEKGAASFAASGSKAKEGTYSMADLQALERKGSWEELLGHAEDVAPAQRSAAWEKMIEKAAIGYMTNLTKDSAAYEGAFSSQSLVKRYPHLAKSQEFMAKRGEAGKNAADICLRDSHRGTRCIEMMKEFLKVEGTTPEVGFAFGKVTRKNQNHYVAVPFFKWALDKKADAAMCGDDDLKLAIVAGLGLPPDYENAQGARSVAANKCWDGLSAAIKKELAENQSSYYRDNACAVLKAKGAL